STRLTRLSRRTCRRLSRSSARWSSNRARCVHVCACECVRACVRACAHGRARAKRIAHVATFGAGAAAPRDERFHVRLHNVTVRAGPTTHGGGARDAAADTPLYPLEARLRGLTYATSLYVDVEKTRRWRDVNGAAREE